MCVFIDLDLRRQPSSKCAPRRRSAKGDEFKCWFTFRSRFWFNVINVAGKCDQSRFVYILPARPVRRPLTSLWRVLIGELSQLLPSHFGPVAWIEKSSWFIVAERVRLVFPGWPTWPCLARVRIWCGCEEGEFRVASRVKIEYGNSRTWRQIESEVY